MNVVLKDLLLLVCLNFRYKILISYFIYNFIRKLK